MQESSSCWIAKNKEVFSGSIASETNQAIFHSINELFHCHFSDDGDSSSEEEAGKDESHLSPQYTRSLPTRPLSVPNLTIPTESKMRSKVNIELNQERNAEILIFFFRGFFDQLRVLKMIGYFSQNKSVLLLVHKFSLIRGTYYLHFFLIYSFFFFFFLVHITHT